MEKGIRALLISLVLAVAAVILVLSFLKEQEKKLLELSAAVVVAQASRDIPQGTRITEDIVSLVEVPKKYLQPGNKSAVDSLLDREAATTILKGTQITESHLVPPGRAGGLSTMIPSDKVAFSLAMSDVTAVSGLLRPGDFVDVLLTLAVGNGDATESSQSEGVEEISSRKILEKILVLAVNQTTSAFVSTAVKATSKNAVGNIAGPLSSTGLLPAGKTGRVATVTLAVSPDDSLKLSLSQDIGTLSLALRSTWSDDGIWKKEMLSAREFLGIKKKVIKKMVPAWLEIRGIDQTQRY